MSKEAMKLALEAINNLITSSHATDPQHWRDARQDAVTALAAIDKALAEQPAQQEPVAEVGRTSVFLLRKQPNGERWPEGTKLYTSPPAQRTWVGLTDEERNDLLDTYITAEGRAQAIEHKLKEKNT